MEANEHIHALTALFHFGMEKPDIEFIDKGLINRTWRVVHENRKFILQRVNEMFPVEVHMEIDAVTRFLVDKGLNSPLLVPTTNNLLYHQDETGTWRMYTYLEGKTVDCINRPEIANQAGCVLGQFHKALLEIKYNFINERSGVHDTKGHIQHLKNTLIEKQVHPRYEEIHSLAREILDESGKLPVLAKTLPRKVHGDPKINNFLFDINSEKGLCMVDFDTLGNMPLALELGDAMRSWCNHGGENSRNTRFSMEYFKAGLEGYALQTADFISTEEWNDILPATQTIFLELAARFCADALNEDYFAWDKNLFDSHSEHSQVRASSQLNAYKSLMDSYAQADHTVREIFS